MPRVDELVSWLSMVGAVAGVLIVTWTVLGPYVNRRLRRNVPLRRSLVANALVGVVAGFVLGTAYWLSDAGVIRATLVTLVAIVVGAVVGIEWKARSKRRREQRIPW